MEVYNRVAKVSCARFCSLAYYALRWVQHFVCVKVMLTSWQLLQLVGPKKQKLKEAEDSLQDANRKLQEKQDALQEVEKRVEGLKLQLVNAQREQRELIDQV